MALKDSWSIKSRAHKCSETEQVFQDGETYYTAIYPDTESSEYVRKDFCAEAWAKVKKSDKPPFSHWNATYKAPVKGESKDVVAKENAEELLIRLINEDEEHTENARYILAVMLERKKILVETDNQSTPSGIIRIYQHKKENDVYIVRDPNIPLADVETVQQEVFDLLAGNDKSPEDADTTTDPTNSSIDDTQSAQTEETDTTEESEPGEDTESAEEDNAEEGKEVGE